MCPSALPSMISRWPSTTATIGTDWVFMSAGRPPGVEIHRMRPFALSNAT